MKKISTNDTATERCCVDSPEYWLRDPIFVGERSFQNQLDTLRLRESDHRMPIEFVFFDLGNVILKFDHGVGVSRLSQQTGVDEASIHAAIFESGLQNDFESGRIESATFVKRLEHELGRNLDPQQTLTAISDIFVLNRQLIPILAQLVANGFPVGVLSNTCAAHWHGILNSFPFIDRYIPECYRVLSFESQSMKPDDKIYQDAIASAGRLPETIFFVDDLSANVAGARRHAIDAVTFTDARQLLLDLHLRGIRINL